MSDQLKALWRRRAIVLSATALGVIIGVGTLVFVPKKFMSEAIIQLDLGTRESAQAAGQSPSVVIEGSAMVQSEVKILRSRVIAHRVVDRLHLADDAGADHRPGIIEQIVAEARSAWDRLVFRSEMPPEPPVARQERIETELMGLMKAEADARSYLISVTYTSEQPEQAARIANAIVDEYVQRRLETNYEAANKMTNWLAGQLQGATRELEAARARVDEYRERNGLLEAPASGESLGQQQLRALTSQLAAANLDRVNAESRLARVTEMVRSGDTPSAADLQGSATIQRLFDQEASTSRALTDISAKFGTNHPAVDQARSSLATLRSAIAAEIRRSVSILSADLAAARRTEEDLKSRLRELETSLIANRSKEAELQGLVVSAQLANDQTTALARSYQQTLALRDLKPIAAVVVSPAEPTRTPSSPKPLIILPISLLGGLLAGIMIAMALESLDRGVRSSAEVKFWASIRCLGMVPEVVSGPLSTRRRIATQAIFDEAVRSVGAALNLFGAKQECRVILVTSSVSGEGKSTLCRALGNALASAGRRVLLVDGTPQRRSVHATVETTEPPVAPAPALIGSPTSALTILQRSSSGTLANMFGSSQFEYWLNEARQQFDVILLEGPPVTVLPDSLVLGRPADAVIYVVRWASTKQKVVEAALERLRECSVVVDGLVLSRVDLRRHATFGFTDQCSQYWKERRLLTRLAGRGKASPPDVSPVA